MSVPSTLPEDVQMSFDNLRQLLDTPPTKVVAQRELMRHELMMEGKDYGAGYAAAAASRQMAATESQRPRAVATRALDEPGPS